MMRRLSSQDTLTACDGCGETPYVKLLSNLFGERLVLANAEGCDTSTVIGSSPCSTDAADWSPAINALCEDGSAHNGLGVAIGIIQGRDALKAKVSDAVAGQIPQKLRVALSGWLEDADNACRSGIAAAEVETELESYKHELPGILAEIYAARDLLPKPSVWVICGDSCWAADVGVGGLDLIMSSGIDINILIVEMYSKIGGTRSKPISLEALEPHFPSNEPRTKDLGPMAMSYGNCYVASCCLEADYAQVSRSFAEAEDYKGTSVISAFAPCIIDGPRGGQSHETIMQAIDEGYWTLYRFRPERAKDPNSSPLMLDSKTVKGKLKQWIEKRERYNTLRKELSKTSREKWSDKGHQKTRARKRSTTGASTQLNPEEQKRKLMESFQKLVDACGNEDGLEENKSDAVVLYGSETGNAEALAHELASDLTERGMENVSCMECNKSSPNDLQDMANCGAVLIIVISTAKEGELPQNSVTWYKELLQERPDKWLSKLRFAVFGLGDSAYDCHDFCKAAAKVERRLCELGAVAVLPRGTGDNQDPEQYDATWMMWQSVLFNLMKLEDPEKGGTEPMPEHISSTALADAIRLHHEQ